MIISCFANDVVEIIPLCCLYSVENENDVVKYLQETNCAKERLAKCANVHTDIRLLLPRRLESLNDAFFRIFSG